MGGCGANGDGGDDAAEELARLRARVAELERSCLSADGVLASVAASSHDCIMLLDERYRITYINRCVPELRKEDVLGRSVLDFLPALEVPRIESELRGVLAGVGPTRYETTWVGSDGRVTVWESRVSPMLRDGEITGAVVVASDVTERHGAALDRDRLFSLSVDMLCVADLDGCIHRVNDAFERVLGFPRNETEDTDLVSLIHPDDRAAFTAALEVLRGGGQVMNLEARFARRDGGYRLLSWHATPELARNLFHGIARDITDQRATEAQLRQSQKMEAIGRLAGGIAHDFNNLVMAVLLNAESAVNDCDASRDPRPRLIDVLSAAHRAADLTRQLLAFSRMQPPRRVETDLNELTESLIGMVERLIPENIDVSFTGAADLPVVLVDRSQIEQVLLNLCLNARDAMPEGGTLSVHTERVEIVDHHRLSPGFYAKMRVRDSGPGVPDELHERIFEPFFTTKDPGRGTGLGLATAYGIVERHDGLLLVDRTVQRGAAFELLFPAHQKSKPTRVIVPRPSASRGTGTILLAEDEGLVRNAVARMLTQGGYDVLVTSDGEEAVETLRANSKKVQLALLDLVMPRLNGLDAYERMRKIRPDLKVVFGSGYPDAPSNIRLPPNAVLLEKPYRPGDLLKSVRAAIAP